MNFPPPNVLLPGRLLLVTDQVASPADFLLHQFLSEKLRGSDSSAKNSTDVPDNAVIILTTLGPEGGGRWKAVASKSVRAPTLPLSVTHPIALSF